MRVVNSMAANSMLRDLSVNTEKLSKLQEQVSSSRRINRPSDDPVGLVDSLRLRTGIDELAKYQKNAQDAQSWMEATDSALDDSGNIMQWIRELAVKSATVILTQTERDAVNKEIAQLKQQLIQISNSTYAGRYIFSGNKTHTEAYDSMGLYQGDDGVNQYEIGVGVKLPINVTGTQVFGNMFTTLDKLMSDISAGSVENISNVDLDQLDTVMNEQLYVRADLGARINRADLVIARADELTVNMSDLLSKTEDVDIAQVMMQLKIQESVYQASLQVGARIIQPTLLDYLR